MSLFNKKDTDPQSVPVQPDRPVKPGKMTGDVISSVISGDMKIKGEVSFKGKARIDGMIEGNVNGEHLILSESGKVLGDLELTTLICHGSIEGNVKAQQVTAHSSSALKGNLVATSLTVESGARLNGEVSSSQPVAQQRTSFSATAQKSEQKASSASDSAEKKETPKS